MSAAEQLLYDGGLDMGIGAAFDAGAEDYAASLLHDASPSPVDAHAQAPRESHGCAAR